MKLLFLTSTLGGGGAETQMAYLAEGLVAAGHELHIAYVGSAGNDESCYPGVELHRIDCCCNYDPRIFLAILNLVRRETPDIVQSWSVQMTVVGWLLKLICRKPWVYREANSSLQPLRKTMRPILRFAVRSADMIVANSRAGSRYWRAVHAEVPCETIVNGFPVSRIDEVPPVDAVSVSAPFMGDFVLFAGRLCAQKNPVLLIKAFMKIAGRCDAGLVVCGSGVLEAEMRSMVHAAKFDDRVCFTGYLEHEMVWGLMKRAKLLVLPSRYEGLPNVAVEAALCGSPLVLSDIPEHRDIFSEDAVFFVDARTDDELAGSMEYALGNPEVADRKRKCARKQVEVLSMAAMVERYIKLYEGI